MRGEERRGEEMKVGGGGEIYYRKWLIHKTCSKHNFGLKIYGHLSLITLPPPILPPNTHHSATSHPSPKHVEKVKQVFFGDDLSQGKNKTQSSIICRGYCFTLKGMKK